MCAAAAIQPRPRPAGGSHKVDLGGSLSFATETFVDSRSVTLHHTAVDAAYWSRVAHLTRPESELQRSSQGACLPVWVPGGHGTLWKVARVGPPADHSSRADRGPGPGRRARQAAHPGPPAGIRLRAGRQGRGGRPSALTGRRRRPGSHPQPDSEASGPLPRAGRPRSGCQRAAWCPTRPGPVAGAVRRRVTHGLDRRGRCTRARLTPTGKGTT
jgi:hypothetical protein